MITNPCGEIPLYDPFKEIKERLRIHNRDAKIESIIENKEYHEKKLQDDEEYMRLCTGTRIINNGVDVFIVDYTSLWTLK